MKMMGRIIGGVLGSAVGRQKGNHPVAGAIIGAGTLFAARRLFPQRYAVLAATVAAGYLTKKWADRAEVRRMAQSAVTATPDAAPSDPQTQGLTVASAPPTVTDTNTNTNTNTEVDALGSTAR